MPVQYARCTAWGGRTLDFEVTRGYHSYSRAACLVLNVTPERLALLVLHPNERKFADLNVLTLDRDAGDTPDTDAGLLPNRAVESGLIRYSAVPALPWLCTRRWRRWPDRVILDWQNWRAQPPDTRGGDW
jgi:hypothetical protein